MAVGREVDPIEEQRRQIEKLFTIPFPELAIENTDALLKALNDRRIAELRQLVADAAAGRVEFDQEFAKDVLVNVLSAERRARRWRNIVGYLTMPIGFVPLIGTVAEKAVSEALGAVAEKVVKKDHRWFYMLSKLAKSPAEPA